MGSADARGLRHGGLRSRLMGGVTKRARCATRWVALTHVNCAVATLCGAARAVSSGLCAIEKQTCNFEN
eukprot:7094966-Pyramimonas_sp.AAC.1